MARIVRPASDYDALAPYRPGAPQRRPGFAVPVLVFAAVYLALFLCYIEASSGPLRALIVDTLTVKPAAFLISLVDPAAGVRAAGHALAWHGGRLSVLNGCDGAETMILVTCAMLVADIGAAARIIGILAGAGLVYALNQARLVVLYALFCSGSEWFDAVHVALAPLALIGSVGAFYLFWTARFGRPREHARA